MATAANRFEPTGLYPLQPNGTPDYALCPDGSQVAATARCFHDAYVVGPDVRWRSASGDYVVNAQAIVSTASRERAACSKYRSSAS